MKTPLGIAAAIAVLLLNTSTADAKRHPYRHHYKENPRYRVIDNMPAMAGCRWDNSGRTACFGKDPPVRQQRVTRRSTRTKYHSVVDASGNVVSHKTGARARVGAAYAAKFQAYIDDLEANGATVRFMGGIRGGRCSSGHMHPCGRALDVCQLSRGRVDGRCNLPSRSTIASIAARHGLFEGGQWCSSDYGHVQAGESAPACGGGTTMMARRHYRHHRRYASR